jgi:outer membrane receptor protein involved in Fe transport
MSAVWIAAPRRSGLAALALGLLSSTAALAQQSDGATPTARSQARTSTLDEVIVTAEKRSESINNVPMSISAISGDSLAAHGVTDTSQLGTLVPGLTFTKTGYMTPVYTIRGVGFQDNTLSAAGSVAVYVDEVPLPFSIETKGVGLDLARVEVLKGPQGTLYGENSTGGAINYIAARPTDHFEAGVDASYGRFNTVSLQGFLSGPLSDTVRARLAVSSQESGPWQQSFSRSDSLGVSNVLTGRLLVDWTPTDRLSVSVNLNATQEKSDAQAPQEYGILPASPANGFTPPSIANFPAAPPNDRAADWDPGVSLRGNNVTYQGAVRLDYAVSPDLKFTSISAYTHFKKDQPVDTDGTPFQLFSGVFTGHAGTYYQELRLSGDVQNRLNWIVGANYQSDKTYDQLFLHYCQASGRIVLGLPVCSGINQDHQNIETKAVYAHADFKLTDTLTLQGGVRYTETDRHFEGCTKDSGDGAQAAVLAVVGPIYRGGPGYIKPLPGQCVTINTQTLQSGLITADLSEGNTAWRTGLNWKPTPDALLYATVAKGYKAGSFPTLSATLSKNFNPVHQESILDYEAGFKLTLLDRTLQLDGAIFYYDYTNKQIKGKTVDVVYGPLAGLVNVPKSTIKGLEVSAVWRPIAGLTISPGATYADSRIEGSFSNYNLLGQTGSFGGEALPYAPKWTGNVDAQYEWPVKAGDLTAFVGANLSFQSATNGSFGDLPVFAIKAYQLLDLRAGVTTPDGKWRFSAWGRNVTDTFYWTSANHITDTFVRFTGMPATYGISVNYRYR